MFRFIDEKWLTIFVLTVFLTIQVSSVYSTDQLTATNSVNYSNEIFSINSSIQYTGPIYAIAISIFLPENVIYISSTTNSKPIIQPQKGDMGTIEFIWLKPPESPFHLNYLVKSASQSAIIHSRVTYRRLNEELHYNLPEIKLIP